MNDRDPDRSGRSRTALLGGIVGFASALVMMAFVSAVTDGDTSVTDATELEQEVAGQTVPAPTVPAQTVPAQTVPAQTVPAQTVPDGSVPPASMAAGSATRGQDVGEAAVVEAASTTSLDGGLPQGPEGPRCGELEAELWRRDEAGEIVDEPYVELTEEEYAAAPLELPVPESRMAAPGERPSFERFGKSYDVVEISTEHLEDAVGRCWEAGLLD